MDYAEKIVNFEREDIDEREAKALIPTFTEREQTLLRVLYSVKDAKSAGEIEKIWGSDFVEYKRNSPSHKTITKTLKSLADRGLVVTREEEEKYSSTTRYALSPEARMFENKFGVLRELVNREE